MKDPLDEIFVKKHRKILWIKGNKKGAWRIREIDFNFMCWLNCWADEDKHHQCYNKDKGFTDFRKGYQQAVSDVMRKLEANHRTKDKRTKSGYSKR